MNTQFIYRDYAIGAKDDIQSITVSPSTKPSYCIPLRLKNNVSSTNYASFENEGINLVDDSLIFMNSTDKLSYISSSTSNTQGIFDTSIYFRIVFNSAHSSSGITFYFDKVPCEQIKVVYYYDSTVLLEKTYTDISSNRFFCQDNVEGYNRIYVYPLKTMYPNSFASIYKIDFGTDRQFDDENVYSANMINNFSKDGRNLAIDKLTLSVIDNEYSNYMFQKNQPIDIYTDNEYTATFYVQNGTSNSITDTVDIECYDFINNIEDDFYGGMYNGTTVSDLAASIVANTGISLSVDETLASIQLYGLIPICTKREALVYLACACGGKYIKHPEFKLVPLNAIVTNSFDNSTIIKDSIYEQQQKIKEVILIENRYSQNKNDSDKVQVYSWYLSASENTEIKFSQPLWDLKSYYLNENNEQIETSNVSFVTTSDNYCVVKNSSTLSAYKIVVEGRPYTKTSIQHSKKSTNISNGEKYSTEKIDGFTIIMNDVTSLLNSLYDYYSQNLIFKGEVLDDNINVGDKITVGELTGHIEKITTEFEKPTKIEVR